MTLTLTGINGGHVIERGSDSESEDMFDLDEEIESEPEVETAEKSNISKLKDLGWKKRQVNKYVDEYLEDNHQPSSRVNETSKEDYTFSTSVPVQIPAIQHGVPSFGTHVERNEKDALHAGFDMSYTDRENSLLMAPSASRRKSLVTPSRSGSRQLENVGIGRSLDTRDRTASRSLHTRDEMFEKLRRSASVLENEDPLEDTVTADQMPPHVWVASTFVDEEEELFGGVPKSGGWQRTME
ncbi:hypothetical protein CLU79DRAFT_182114 [Phycomyces nitens]|nr:hypothetical protein CLU79DRAFT_182114 [Phycomyces nitens]